MILLWLLLPRLLTARRRFAESMLFPITFAELIAYIPGAMPDCLLVPLTAERRSADTLLS